MAARRVPAWNDQVPRLQAFRAAHPDVEIMTPVDTRSPWWKAFADVPAAHLGQRGQHLPRAVCATLVDGLQDGQPDGLVQRVERGGVGHQRGL